jgi:hypothetical protein
MPMTIREMRRTAVAHETRRGWLRTYPDNPMLDEDFGLKAPVLRALRRFKRQLTKLRRRGVRKGRKILRAVERLYDRLSRTYDIPTPRVLHDGMWRGDTGNSCYQLGASGAIVLRGRLSIITVLHEFAHARGYGETGAVWWSVNAFRKVWKRAFARLVSAPGTHVLRRAPRPLETRTGGAARVSYDLSDDSATPRRRQVNQMPPERPRLMELD